MNQGTKAFLEDRLHVGGLNAVPPVVVVVGDEPVLAIIVPALSKDPVVNILVALVLLVDRSLIHPETWHLDHMEQEIREIWQPLCRCRAGAPGSLDLRIS